jgi:hypothetical protein
MSRPNQFETEYDPSICTKIPDMFADGASITEVAAAKIGIARSTYYLWKDTYPEFKRACELGENMSEIWWERKAKEGMQGQIENYNAATLIFVKKSRFRQTYGEQKEEKSAGDTLLEQLVSGKVKLVSA